MKRFILAALSVLTLGFAADAQAYEFKYHETFTCGPSEFKGTYKSLGNGRGKYFFVNIAADGEFVILQNDIQFKSFEPFYLTQLYHQNGGMHTATHQNLSGIDVYELRTAQPGKEDYVTNFMLDRSSMTYTARSHRGDATFNPQSGVCFGYVKHK